MDKMNYSLIYTKYLGILQPDQITSLLMTTCLCLLYGRMEYWNIGGNSGNKVFRLSEPP